MYIFPIKNGDIPASYVSLSEGIYTFAVHFVVVPLQAPKAPQLRRVPGPVGLGASGAPTVGWVGGMILGIPTWMDGWKIDGKYMKIHEFDEDEYISCWKSDEF